MTETNLNKKIIIDIWTMIVGLFLLVQIPVIQQFSEAQPAGISTSAGNIVTIAFFIVIGAVILLCTRLHKYRYLILYTNCKKGTKWVYLAILLIPIFLFLMQAWTLNYIAILHLAIVVIVSFHTDNIGKDLKETL